MTVDRVREARAEDTPAMGTLQRDGWRAAYAGVLPGEVLAELRADLFAAAWRNAVEHPPTPRHRVLTAVSGDEVAGFAAIGPATDPDRERDGELYGLYVHPGRLGHGHGSRLLSAAIDHLREDGFASAVTWVLAADEALVRFLAGAGWAPDGARRDLDVSGDATVTLPQLRLHTDLTPPN